MIPARLENGVLNESSAVGAVAIVAAGYETRASRVATLLHTAPSERIALDFANHQTALAREENNRKLERLGYQRVTMNADASEDAENFFGDVLSALASRPESLDQPPRIVVDISSMTRVWYGGFVRAIAQHKELQHLIVDFVYTPAVYEEALRAYPQNEIVAPIPGYASLALPERPTALVLGLGSEPERAVGLWGHLDPTCGALFFADPGSDERYDADLRSRNQELFRRVPVARQLGYPLRDPLATYQMLLSAVLGIRGEFSVVLASLGPKIFGLCCFLLAAVLPDDCSVWRVSASTRVEPRDKLPDPGPPIVATVSWTGGTADPPESD